MPDDEKKETEKSEDATKKPQIIVVDTNTFSDNKGLGESPKVEEKIIVKSIPDTNPKKDKD